MQGVLDMKTIARLLYQTFCVSYDYFNHNLFLLCSHASGTGVSSPLWNVPGLYYIDRIKSKNIMLLLFLFLFLIYFSLETFRQYFAHWWPIWYVHHRRAANRAIRLWQIKIKLEFALLQKPVVLWTDRPTFPVYSFHIFSKYLSARIDLHRYSVAPINNI